MVGPLPRQPGRLARHRTTGPACEVTGKHNRYRPEVGARVSDRYISGIEAEMPEDIDRIVAAPPCGRPMVTRPMTEEFPALIEPDVPVPLFRDLREPLYRRKMLCTAA